MRRVLTIVAIFLIGIVNWRVYGEERLSASGVFDEIAGMEKFEVMDFDGGAMGFPEEFGRGMMAIHPNASPGAEISLLVGRLPEENLIFDDTDSRGRFTRIWLEDGQRLLFVMVGTGTADTVAIYFREVNEDALRSLLSKIEGETN